MSDDFLSRWSRRKRDPDAAPDEEAPAAQAAAASAAEEPPVEEDDGEILARLGLKHPDEMGPGDDFAGFLRAAVPQHLRTLALRRLWRSNPTLACLDGLNDYDTDFTGTGVPEGGLKTSYQVGRGILRRIAEAEAPDDPKGAEEAPPVQPEHPEETAGQSEAGAGTADTEAAETPAELQASEIVQQNDTSRATRRRMVFRAKG